jgi:farnesyl diphosphate synthase
MHRRKTGALLRASVVMGASCGDPGEQAHRALQDYGEAIGLAFQVIDDVLDCTQASDKLGKTAGKDLHSNKPTYVTAMGVQEARAYAFGLRDQARQALARSGLPNAAVLSILADRVVERDN